MIKIILKGLFDYMEIYAEDKGQDKYGNIKIKIINQFSLRTALFKKYYWIFPYEWKAKDTYLVNVKEDFKHKKGEIINIPIKYCDKIEKCNKKELLELEKIQEEVEKSEHFEKWILF